jgi:hypothetical protein
MPSQDQSTKGAEAIDGSMIWQIWISDNLNQEADILVRWSRTSFFGGSPVSQPRHFSGNEYALFHRCNAEWAMKYVLAIAISNYRLIKLLKNNQEVPIEPYFSELPRPSGTLLGDAASMGRSGGMC